MRITEIPDWVVYPEEDWKSITPEEAGLDTEKFHRFPARIDVKGSAFGGKDHTGEKFGTVITRGGYLVHTWGDGGYKYQTALTGKAFTYALLGLVVQEGMVEADDLIADTWTRATTRGSRGDTWWGPSGKRGTTEGFRLSLACVGGSGGPGWRIATRSPASQSGPTGRATLSSTSTRTPSRVPYATTAVPVRGERRRPSRICGTGT